MPHALIVEDDPNSLSGLSAILAADSFSVDTATTLAEARAALTRFIPDVVLVDLNLPDGSGLDLLQHLPAQPWDPLLLARCGIRPAVPASHRARVARQSTGAAYRVFRPSKNSARHATRPNC